MVNYNPQQDPTIPCADAGISFSKGDILEIVDQTDALWWQARKLPSDTCCAGLIPSSSLLKRCEMPPTTKASAAFKITQFYLWHGPTKNSFLLPTGSRGSCGGRSLTCLMPACISVRPASLPQPKCQSRAQGHAHSVVFHCLSC